MHWFLKFILGMKLCMFRTVPLSIIRSFSLYTQQRYMSYRSASRIRMEHPDPARKLSANQEFFSLYTQQRYMSYRSASRIRMEHPDPARKLSANQEFFTVHTATVYVLQVCEQDQNGTSWSCSQAVSKSGVFHCTHSNGICHTGLRAGSGFIILILLASCQQTCMTFTIAVRTVKNSWWWTEELSETCRISFQE